MSLNKDQSFDQLKEFVIYHKLQNNSAVTKFEALITLKTQKNEFEGQEMSVIISFEKYRKLAKLILNHSLDSYSFPKIFFPDYQNFQHINNTYLLIQGVHPSVEIGKYSVKIYPVQAIS